MKQSGITVTGYELHNLTIAQDRAQYAAEARTKLNKDGAIRSLILCHRDLSVAFKLT
jgi:hypothetical protein